MWLKNVSTSINGIICMVHSNLDYSDSLGVRRLVSLVGKMLNYCAGGSGSIRDWTNTQDLKIIEKKVLPLL